MGPIPSLLARSDEFEAKRWAEDRFERALLLLGDLTDSLRHLATYWIVHEEFTKRVRGLAVKFDGFYVPVASIVADDEDATDSLLRVLRNDDCLLVVNALQKLPSASQYPRESTDSWMFAPCESSAGQQRESAELVSDAKELEDFFQRVGRRFWCAAMSRFDHNFGVRARDGRLISAGCVSFVLEGLGYAHIGPLATDPAERGRNFGTQVLAAIVSNLALSGIRKCGLFADGAEPGLVRYYEDRGFTKRGEFHFLSSFATGKP